MLQIDVPDRQAAEFGNPQSRVEQDVHPLIIPAVDVVPVDKFQEFAHLLRRDGLSGNGVIDQHAGHIKVEGIKATMIRCIPARWRATMP